MLKSSLFYKLVGGWVTGFMLAAIATKLVSYAGIDVASPTAIFLTAAGGAMVGVLAWFVERADAPA